MENTAFYKMRNQATNHFPNFLFVIITTLNNLDHRFPNRIQIFPWLAQALHADTGEGQSSCLNCYNLQPQATELR